MAGVARYDDQVRWDDDESYIHEDSLIVDARASLNAEQVAGGYDVGGTRLPPRRPVHIDVGAAVSGSRGPSAAGGSRIPAPSKRVAGAAATHGDAYDVDDLSARLARVAAAPAHHHQQQSQQQQQYYSVAASPAGRPPRPQQYAAPVSPAPFSREAARDRIRRMKEREIERENWRLYQRLTSAKPTVRITPPVALPNRRSSGVERAQARPEWQD